MTLVRRGRSIGVRITVNGEKKWLGTVSGIACERCDGKPEMCARCRVEAEKRALSIEEKGKRAHVWRRESCTDFAERWLVDFNHKGKRWDDSTLRHYRDALRTFKQRFASVPLADVTPTQARSWANTTSLSYVRAVRAMFNDALADELIERNPFAKLKLEESPGRADIVAITEDELILLASLASRIHGATFSAMVAVAGYTGIRQGELFALEPHDFHGDELAVRYQWTGHELKRPKDKEARRVAFPRAAAPYVDALPSYLGGIRCERVSDGEREHVEVRPVFRNRHGGLWRAGSLSLAWGSVRSAFEAKIDPARAQELRDGRCGKSFAWHELRHFAATEILRLGGTEDDAAHQLGHEDTKLIQRRYGHLEEQIKLDRVKRLYGGNVKPIRVEESEAANSEAANG